MSVKQSVRWSVLCLSLGGALTPLGALGDAPDEPATEAQPAPIGFAEAVRRATRQTTDVAVAEAQLRRAEALREQARAAWLPTLTVNATYTRLDADRILGGRLVAGANQFNANVLLTAPLIAGARWAAYGRAQQAESNARLSLDDARRRAAVAVARAFLSVASQHRTIDTFERARANAETHARFAQQRLDGGVGSRTDLLRAQQDAAVARGQIASARLVLSRLQASLGVLLGEERPFDAREDVPLEGPRATPSERDVRAALESAGQRRTDVRVARARVSLAERGVREGWVDYLPTLLATVQPYYQNPPTVTQPEFGWQAQLVLSVPLFDGGVRYGVQHERVAAAAEARVSLDGLLRQARAEVRAAVEAVRRAEEAADAARDAQRLADASVELAEASFREGASTNLELIDAQRRARDAAAAANAAEDSAREARLDLLIASGRFP